MEFIQEHWLLLILGIVLVSMLVFFIRLGKRGRPVLLASGIRLLGWLTTIQRFYLSSLRARRWTINLLGAVLILWSAKTFSVWIQPALTPADIFPPPFSGPKAVKAQIVDIGPVVKSVRYTGTVKPYESNIIFARVDGFVEELTVYEGDLVSKGDLLARLDVSSLKPQLLKAMADSTYRLAEFRRGQELFKNSVINASDFGNIKRIYEIAAATVMSIRTKIKYATITANINGWVTERRIYPGQYVHKGEKILRVDRLDSVRVQFKVSDRDLPFIHEGDVVWVKFPQISMLAFRKEGWNQIIRSSNEENVLLALARTDSVEYTEEENLSLDSKAIPGIKARVAVVFPVEDPVTHTGIIELRLPNPGTLLKSGAYAIGHFAVERVKETTRVPTSSVVRMPDGRDVVFVAPPFSDEGAAEMREVSIGLQTNDYTQIFSGVEPNEFVIYAGQRSLVDGEYVSVIHREGFF